MFYIFFSPYLTGPKTPYKKSAIISVEPGLFIVIIRYNYCDNDDNDDDKLLLV